MSLSFSPSSEYLLVGVRSSKIFGCFLKISQSRDISNNSQPQPKWIHSVEDDGKESLSGNLENVFSNLNIRIIE